MPNYLVIGLVVSAVAVAALATPASAAPIRSSDAVPQPAPQSSHASTKSQGLPNADGEKPGKGHGFGHDKGRGQGHDKGRGHGHDSDSPG